MFAARLSITVLLLLPDGPLSAGQALFRAASEANVNQRYTIESVSIGGVQVERAKLPSSLRQRLVSMVGARCDMAAIGEIASDLRKELHLRSVNEHLSRGSQPDQIRVNFEVVKRDVAFEISVPKFLYHSQQGFTGEVQASTRVGQNTFTLGAVSNGDDLTERFTGLVARYQDAKVFTDKVRFGIGFEDFHEQWNDSTRNAMATAPTDSGLDIYRTRRNIAPELTFAPAKSVTISAGVSFEQMQLETPGAAQRSANAITADVHYSHAVEGDLQQTLDGKYSLRIGTRGLGSDYSYSRHMVSMRYQVKSGRHIAADEVMGGTITGDAPFFERFVLGSSSTLRGWDRYAMSPLGGTRAVHNSLSYGYQFGEGTAEVFYDSGALWNRDRGTGGVRHSLGVGYRQGIFVLTMAFPVVEGRVSPVFMAGMNY
ncbi:MAG: BamA/TamA family outer membrane protein [Acidobacteriota bacterium]